MCLKYQGYKKNNVCSSHLTISIPSEDVYGKSISYIQNMMKTNLHVVCVADLYLLSEGPEWYHYLSQSGCVQDGSLDDQQLFDSVMVRISPVSVSS